MEEEIRQKAKLFIESHKENKYMFNISLENLLTLFATEITKELQQDIKHKKIAIQNRKAKIKDLNKQIEKMKCCYNCSKWYDGECEERPKSKILFCADFKCDKWELAE